MADSGWYPDAASQEVVRYWDGAQWTEERAWNGSEWVERPLGSPVVPSIAAPLEPVPSEDNPTPGPELAPGAGVQEPSPPPDVPPSNPPATTGTVGGSVGDGSMREELVADSGWYPDAASQEVVRYWDGAQWTEERAWNGSEWVERPLGSPVVPSIAAPATPPEVPPPAPDPVSSAGVPPPDRAPAVLSATTETVVGAPIGGTGPEPPPVAAPSPWTSPSPAPPVATPPPSDPGLLLPADGTPRSGWRRRLALVALAIVVAAASAAVTYLVRKQDDHGVSGSTAGASRVATRYPARSTTTSTSTSTTTSTTTTTQPTPTATIGKVARTCGAGGAGDCFLSIRSGPSGASPEVGRLLEGQPIGVVCQVQGDPVNSSVLGRSSTAWTRTVDGTYVASIYVDAVGFDPLSVAIPCP